MKKLNLVIDRTNDVSIKASFNRIAKEIFSSAIKVNNHILGITEIEFYFWSDEHKDYTTHEHSRNAGEWRMHNQGLDITLQAEGNNKSGQVGGILIRGIYHQSNDDNKKSTQYINGPRMVLFQIFQLMGKVEEESTLQLLPNYFETIPTIYTTTRHGLKPAVTKEYIIDDEFLSKPYRYIAHKERLSYPTSYWKDFAINELQE